MEKFEYNKSIRLTKQYGRKKLVISHWHHHFEMIKVTKGKVVIKYGCEAIAGHEGDIFVIPSKVMHGVEQISEDGEVIGLVVEPVYLLSLVTQYPTRMSLTQLINNHLIQKKVTQSDEIWRILNRAIMRMFDVYEKKELLYELILVEEIMRIMQGLSTLNQSSFATFNSKDMYVLEPVFSYVQSCYQENITVKNMSDLVAMSPSHFSRFFKQATGQSPMNYVLDVRMNEAVRKLKYSTTYISEIAFETGFQSSNYFTKVFKQYHEMSPREFREKFKKDDN